MATTPRPLELDLDEILAPDGYAMRVIRYRAGWLVRQKGVPEQEQSDIEQELALRLLKRLKKYDPARAQLNTYIANCVRFEALEVLRQRFADKHVIRRATRSLDVVIGHRLGRRRSLGDVMTRSQQVRGKGRIEQDDQLQVDLHEDFQAVIAKLPPRLQKICRKLLEARSPAALRQTVSASDLAAIRRHFEQAGLRDYL
jgi:RNA polymerase sigma-70 factor (ECF subfamily)